MKRCKISVTIPNRKRSLITSNSTLKSTKKVKIWNIQDGINVVSIKYSDIISYVYSKFSYGINEFENILPNTNSSKFEEHTNVVANVIENSSKNVYGNRSLEINVVSPELDNAYNEQNLEEFKHLPFLNHMSFMNGNLVSSNAEELQDKITLVDENENSIVSKSEESNSDILSICARLVLFTCVVLKIYLFFTE